MLFNSYRLRGLKFDWPEHRTKYANIFLNITFPAKSLRSHKCKYWGESCMCFILSKTPSSFSVIQHLRKYKHDEIQFTRYSNDKLSTNFRCRIIGDMSHIKNINSVNH